MISRQTDTPREPIRQLDFKGEGVLTGIQHVAISPLGDRELHVDDLCAPTAHMLRPKVALLHPLERKTQFSSWDERLHGFEQNSAFDDAAGLMTHFIFDNFDKELDFALLHKVGDPGRFH